MKGLFWLKVLSLAAVVLIAAAGTVLPAFAGTHAAGNMGGRPMSVDMSGAVEVPGPGDPDGSGTAIFTLNQGLGMVCWELTVENIDPAAAAHIHRAPTGQAGPVVVTLSAPTEGTSSGCAEVDSALVMEIRQYPEMFYVNVHNAAYPAGAVRGQLSK